MTNKRGGKIQSIQDLLLNYNLEDKGKYISQEFQDYGYRLAMEMGEEKNKSLYIKLAKTEDRLLLEKARAFVKDAHNVRHKGKLFLWAIKKLRNNEPLYSENSEPSQTRSEYSEYQKFRNIRSSESQNSD